MQMTPLEIQQKQFRTRFRGFDVREVDLFLEQTAAAFENLQRENEQLQEKIRRLKMEVQGYQKREETFKQAMINSQKVIEQMKENARKSADLIVGEAEVKAEKNTIVGKMVTANVTSALSISPVTNESKRNLVPAMVKSRIDTKSPPTNSNTL